MDASTQYLNYCKAIAENWNNAIKLYLADTNRPETDDTILLTTLNHFNLINIINILLDYEKYPEERVIEKLNILKQELAETAAYYSESYTSQDYEEKLERFFKLLAQC